jgi:hypothetical protein
MLIQVDAFANLNRKSYSHRLTRPVMVSRAIQELAGLIRENNYD